MPSRVYAAVRRLKAEQMLALPLVQRYGVKHAAARTVDSYAVSAPCIPGKQPQFEEYLQAFYNTPPMLIERNILRTIGHPYQSASDIAALSWREGDRVAVFQAEHRGEAPNGLQYLGLSFELGNLRGYSMHHWYHDTRQNRLDFTFGSFLYPLGSEGAPTQSRTASSIKPTGPSDLFDSIGLAFHDLYSRVLLASAVAVVAAV
jgi:hypothetical protein